MPTPPSITARQAVEMIERAINIQPRADTVDTFKAGDPEAVVRGVAVAMMPGLPVLRSAVEQGCNLVIAHEPAFYGHLDDTRELESEGDAVWKAKSDFIERHELILWRFHDLPHLQRPDAILAGMAEGLGWQKFQSREDGRLFELPPTTLETLAREVRRALGIKALRVVGEGEMEVARVALSPGCPGFGAQRKLLARPDVEVLVMGEAREWETIAYAADASAAGMRKALLILGHIPSEECGMRACAAWIAGLLPAPVAFIPTPEPFWTPGL